MIDRIIATARELARSLPAPVVRQIATTLLIEKVIDVERASQIIRDVSPTARHQRLTTTLLLEWRNNASELPPAAIAGMLLGTELKPVLADDLALVWTGPGVLSVPSRRTDQALIEVIDSAQQQLTIVSFVAYRVPRVRERIRRAAARDVYVRIVIESPDESAGKVAWWDLGEVADSVGRIEFFVWPPARRPTDDRGNRGSLHAKLAIADQTKLFVSSANLTEHALSLNMEMGVLIEAGDLPRQAQELVDGLIRGGTLMRIPSTPS